MHTVSAESVYKILSAKKQAPESFKKILTDSGIDVNSMKIDLYRASVLGSFIEHLLYKE
jgi:transposase